MSDRARRGEDKNVWLRLSPSRCRRTLSGLLEEACELINPGNGKRVTNRALTACARQGPKSRMRRRGYRGPDSLNHWLTAMIPPGLKRTMLHFPCCKLRLALAHWRRQDAHHRWALLRRTARFPSPGGAEQLRTAAAPRLQRPKNF
jgi:hypothetical protein